MVRRGPTGRSTRTPEVASEASVDLISAAQAGERAESLFGPRAQTEGRQGTAKALDRLISRRCSSRAIAALSVRRAAQ